MFVDFVCTGQLRIEMFNEYKFSKGFHADFGKITKSIIHEITMFPESSKIDTNEN